VFILGKLKEDFVAVVRERKTGQKNITIPKAVSQKYVPGKIYFIYISEEPLTSGDAE
jgi:hypothetical protein